MKTKEVIEVKKRDFIKPDSLAAFLKTCTDDELCGRVCRAIAGQDVRTSVAENTIVQMILSDLDSYSHRVMQIREECRIRKERWRKAHENDGKKTVGKTNEAAA